MSNQFQDSQQDEVYLYENNQEKLYATQSHGTKQIWKIFWYLSGITVIDVFFYFAMDHTMGRNILFIALGVVKSFLIIAYFMHMKQEDIKLVLMIALPMILILVAIAAILKEGASHMM